MPLQRRQFLVAASASGWAYWAPTAGASEYPNRALRWLVGFPPGGGATIATRVMANWLTSRLKYPVVVENKPGASGNLAVQEAVKADPDGHNLLLVPASAVVNRALFTNLPFDVLTDLAPVAGLIEFALVMLAAPSVPARTVEALVSYATENPSKLNLASFGTGTTSHLAGELFQTMTATKFTHIPYPGEAAALTDLIGGRVHLMFSVLTTSLPHIRANSVKALAVAGRQRNDLLPDVPSISETVAAYEANSWLGVAVPGGTNREIIHRLNNEINAGLADTEVKSRFASLAASPMVLTPDDFKRYMVAEADKWGGMVRSLGLRAS